MSHVYCSECGFQNPETANYCSRCGALLEKGEPATETTQTWAPDEVGDLAHGSVEGLEGPALVVRSGGGRTGESFRPSGQPEVRFRGGCTLLVDLATAEVRYMVRKKIQSPGRLASQLDFRANAARGLRANYFAGENGLREPFAMMHRVHG